MIQILSTTSCKGVWKYHPRKWVDLFRYSFKVVSVFEIQSTARLVKKDP